MAYSGTTPTVAVLAALAQECQTAYVTHAIGMLGSWAELNYVNCYDLQNPTNNYGQYASPTAGGRTGTELPNNICMLLNFSPNRRYRGSKPKIWLPWGVESDVGGGQQWTTGFVTSAAASWAAFMTALDGYTTSGTTLGGQVAVSYYSGKTKNPNPNGRLQYVPTPRATPLVMNIVSVAANAKYSTQRRRIGRG